MSLLRRIGAGEDAKSIRARIPADLADALDAFDRDAKRQGFEFPRDDIVADALRKALAKARAELDKLAGNYTDSDPDEVAAHQRRLPSTGRNGDDGSKRRQDEATESRTDAEATT